MGHFNPYNIKKGTDLQLVNGLIKNELIEVQKLLQEVKIFVYLC